MLTQHAATHCVVEYVGFQPGLKVGSGFNLYNLVEPARVGNHVAGSTVSAKTLHKHGFTHATIINSWASREVELI